MLTLAASSPPARAHTRRSAESDIEQYLVAASEDPRHRPLLYGSLLASSVYVTDCEMVLGDEGPYVELAPGGDGRGHRLTIYTSRGQISDPIEAYEAERVPFAAVLRGLRSGVALVLNPEGPYRHRIGSTELELLRRVLAGD